MTANCAAWRFGWAAHEIWALGMFSGGGAGPNRMHVNNIVQRMLAGGNSLRAVFQYLTENEGMGAFLDNMGNLGNIGGNNLANDRIANQNYVRELLQLFSLGQWLLNKDGTYQLDVAGNRIRSYLRDDILAAAQAFSGFQVNHAVSGPTMHYMRYPGQYGTNYGALSAKVLPTFGISIPALTGSPSLATMEANMRSSVNQILDYLANSDTTLVYLAKEFIHKMVTDNPSPQYVRRVFAALEDNGSGVRGDLKAMCRAIWLDPEARGNSKPSTFGRALDWWQATAAQVRCGQMTPLDETTNVSARFFVEFEDILAEGGNDTSGLSYQMVRPGIPNSVFGYYPFDATAPGADDFFAPATRVWHPSAIISAMKTNMGHSVTHLPLSGINGGVVYSKEWQLTDMIAGTPTNAQLIDRAIEELTCGRTIPAGARTLLIDTLDHATTNATWMQGGGTPALKVRAAYAIGLVASQPEAMEVI